MTSFFEVVQNLFLLAAMVYCLVVVTVVVVCLIGRIHEYWFVSDAIRFARCPNCGAAKSHDGRSSLKLLLSPPPRRGAFVNRRFGRFVGCRVCHVVCFAFSRADREPGLGTWFGDVDFEVVDDEDTRSVIELQSRLWPSCVLLHSVFVAMGLVCLRFLVLFYVHSIIAVFSVVVLLFVLTRPKPKRPKRKYSI